LGRKKVQKIIETVKEIQNKPTKKNKKESLKLKIYHDKKNNSKRNKRDY
jgi:hypothetical protein